MDGNRWEWMGMMGTMGTMGMMGMMAGSYKLKRDVARATPRLENNDIVIIDYIWTTLIL